MEQEKNRILRLQEVMDRTGMSRATLYAAMKRGDFPQSIQISKRCVGWLEADIEAWIKALKNMGGYNGI
jgi:prophage regulatory protein